MMGWLRSLLAKGICERDKTDENSIPFRDMYFERILVPHRMYQGQKAAFRMETCSLDTLLSGILDSLYKTILPTFNVWLECALAQILFKGGEFPPGS